MARTWTGICALALAAGLMVMPGGAAVASDDGRPSIFPESRGADEGGHESFIPVKYRTGNQEDIRFTLIIDAKGHVVLAPMGVAVLTDNANRIELLDEVPLIGELFRGRPKRKVLTPERRVGAAYTAGPVLVVDLRPGAPVGSGADDGAPAPPRDVLDWLDRVQDKGARQRRDRTEIATRDGATITIDNLQVANQSSMFTIDATELVTAAPPGVPALSQVPAIGALFRSRTGEAYRHERDLIVLISPTVMKRDW